MHVLWTYLTPIHMLNLLKKVFMGKKLIPDNIMKKKTPDRKR